MESTTNRLTKYEVARLISDGLLCPYPRPVYRPHEYNAAATAEVMAMSPEQRKQWLAEKRKERAAMLEMMR